MNESPAGSALGWALADVNVSLPLGSTDRELIRLAKDSEAGTPWKAEVVVRLCMESIETMEDALETTGETMLSLLPQETMWLAIRRRERDSERHLRLLSI
jgi:hypothetical protein